MNNNKQKLHRQQGFTLVEIMIALLVFMVIMLGVAGGLLTVLRTNKGNVVRDEALRLAEDELNRLKGEQFSVFGTSGALAATDPPTWTAPANVLSNIRGGAFSFVRSTQIDDLATAAIELKRIDVAVGWDDPAGGAALPATGMNRQVSLSTIIVRSD
ncbi:MAG: prepilin-type N-terminal cleavage/methylation domain-containing protein [Deltaproteobacteria bacterium]|uniref:type IV pilus modification PilV family protein n=1 Tax=Hydrosulfovibrio ferrireducens TaxID=2934181 RepID=UPI0011F8CAC3|nr:MAG: prepilin-type N-terminal cleavage/methylation domain-containing protein [Deltaproteobacteria bacterium]